MKDGLTRHLAIERENEIASNLAFLSAISIDNQKVMAVSVEKHPNGKDRNFNSNVASNSGDLSEFTNGLRDWEDWLISRGLQHRLCNHTFRSNLGNHKHKS